METIYTSLLLKNLLKRKLIKKQSDLILLAAKKLKCKVKIIGYITTISPEGQSYECPFYEVIRGQKRFLSVGSTTQQTSYLGMKLAVNKQMTTAYLRENKIPVPFQMEIKKLTDFSKILKKYKPIVVKPAASRAGKGIFANIFNKDQGYLAYKNIQKIIPLSKVIAEEQIDGNEFRVVVINYKFAAALFYQPATVIGDGRSKIIDLIKKENKNPLRKKGWIEKIKINDALDINLQSIGLTVNSVLNKGQEIVLHRAAPISNGGFLIDVTETVNRENRKLFEKIAHLVRLDIVGIDVIAPSLDKSVVKNNGRIIEVNGGPDFLIHYNVHVGKSRNLAEIVLREYFEKK